MEYLDVLNDKGEKTGEKLSKCEVHDKELWHLAANLWVITPDHKILLQKRSKHKKAFPGYWSQAASGHISADETSIKGMIRETKEEIGLELKPFDLEHLFSFSKKDVFNGRKVMHRGRFDVYLACKIIDIDKIKIQPEEVEEVKFVTFEELKQMTLTPELMLPFPSEYPKVIEILEKRFATRTM